MALTPWLVVNWPVRAFTGREACLRRTHELQRKASRRELPTQSDSLCCCSVLLPTCLASGWRCDHGIHILVPSFIVNRWQAFYKALSPMSTVQFARIREQGITFGVVVVKDYVIDNAFERDEAVTYWSNWVGCPTILLGANRHRLYGRNDLVRFMRNVSIDRIPWRRSTIAA